MHFSNPTCNHYHNIELASVPNGGYYETDGILQFDITRTISQTDFDRFVYTDLFARGLLLRLVK